jgi:HEAT repeat protein
MTHLLHILVLASLLLAAACGEQRHSPSPAGAAKRAQDEVRAIADSGKPDRAKKLASYLDNEEPAAVATACFELGQLKAREYLPNLVALLKHNDDRVVNMAAASLRDMLEPSDAKLTNDFEALLSHRFLLVRIGAVEALGQLRSQRSAELLSQKLKTEDPAVRYYIIDSLRKIRDKRALPALEGYLREVQRMDHSSGSKARARGMPPHPTLLQEALERAIVEIEGAT